MKGLIVYATKHGSVAKAAELLLAHLPKTTDVVDLSRDAAPSDLTKYDFVLIGASVYAGKIQKSVIRFLKNYESLLLQQPLGLFVCAGEKNPEKQRQQLEKAFPEKFVQHATATATVGSAFYVEKLNFLEKLIVRIIKGNLTNYENFDEQAIAQFAQTMLGKERK